MTANLLLAFVDARALRRALLATACATVTGCASVKEMTADFERKWDDPKSILAEMDETANANRAAASSAAQMTSFNSNDCTKKFKLLEPGANEGADFKDRQIGAGECLLDSGKNAEAATLFATIIEGDAANAAALQGKGVALVRLGQFADAAATLRAAIENDGAQWRAWNALGVALDNQGDAEEVFAAFRRASELNPAEGAPLNNLGVALVKVGRRQEAIEAFKQALALDGAKESAEANLRMAYALEGDYASSVKALSDEKRPVALNNAGVAAAARGDTDDAKRLFARALDESPHFYAKAYSNLSLLVE